MALWLISLITVLVVYASIHSGHWLFNYTKKGSKSVFEPSSAAIGAMMGLLAFMLAFAFSMGAQRLDVRKNLMVDEMNAIGTLHLRSDFLPEQERSAMKLLLVEYVKLRVDLRQDPKLLESALSRSNEINADLWQIVRTYSADHPDNNAIMPLIEATNIVIDVYGSRVFAGRQHIPIIIWTVLVAMTILAMIAMGFQMAASGKMSTLLSIIMTITFSAVLFLIADLDRYDQGFFVLPEKPMIDFYESIRK